MEYGLVILGVVTLIGLVFSVSLFWFLFADDTYSGAWDWSDDDEDVI